MSVTERRRPRRYVRRRRHRRDPAALPRLPPLPPARVPQLPFVRCLGLSALRACAHAREDACAHAREQRRARHQLGGAGRVGPRAGGGQDGRRRRCFYTRGLRGAAAGGGAFRTTAVVPFTLLALLGAVVSFALLRQKLKSPKIEIAKFEIAHASRPYRTCQPTRPTVPPGPRVGGDARARGGGTARAWEDGDRRAAAPSASASYSITCHRRLHHIP